MYTRKVRIVGRQLDLDAETLPVLLDQLTNGHAHVHLGPVEFIDRLRSHTAEMIRCRTLDRELIVKVSAGRWSDGEARAAYQEMARIETLLGSEGSVRGVKPIGWTDKPASLWTEYVAGKDLRQILGDLESSEDATLWAGATDALRRCGMGLAAYHKATTHVYESVESAEHFAEEYLANGVRMLLVNRTRLDRVVRDLGVVKLYGDITPSNLRVGNDGILYFFDPPTRDLRGFVHKDLNRFVRGIERALRSSAWDSKRTLAASASAELVRAFLGGYKQASGLPVTSDDHIWLVKLYEMLWRRERAMRRLQKRQLRGAITDAGAVLRARIALVGA